MKSLKILIVASCFIVTYCKQGDKPTERPVTTVEENMEEGFNEATWKFPIDMMEVDSAALCFFRPDEDVINCGGGRIELKKILLPNINYGYEKDTEEELHISFRFDIPVTSLSELEGKKISLEGKVEASSEDLGSVYAFGVHNPVGWQEIRFGKVADGYIDAELDLFFDFDSEDAIGGKFHHTFKLKLSQENRWEL